MTSVFSWKNSVSLCPASFCTPRPNLPVTPGSSWLPTFACQSPMMKRTSFFFFFGISFRRSCRSSQNRSASSALVVGARPYITMILKGLHWKRTEVILSFWDCTQVLHFWLFCWLWWLLHFFLGILAHSSRYNGHLN